MPAAVSSRTGATTHETSPETAATPTAPSANHRKARSGAQAATENAVAAVTTRTGVLPWNMDPSPVGYAARPTTQVASASPHMAPRAHRGGTGPPRNRVTPYRITTTHDAVCARHSPIRGASRAGCPVGTSPTTQSTTKSSNVATTYSDQRV